MEQAKGEVGLLKNEMTSTFNFYIRTAQLKEELKKVIPNTVESEESSIADLSQILFVTNKVGKQIDRLLYRASRDGWNRADF